MLSCDSPEVAQCDSCLLSALEPSLMQKIGDQPGCSQIQQLLTLFREVLNQRAIVSLTLDRRIEVINSLAEQLLDQYFGYQRSNSLPACLDRWLKQQISQCLSNEDMLFSVTPLPVEQSRQLLIYWILDRTKERIFLLLEERELPSFSIPALESMGLTQREAEVLFWVAKDKSNGEIAKTLDCCEGTVRKHLEHLYKKLEVQTRMGAVMTAMERLGLLRA